MSNKYYKFFMILIPISIILLIGFFILQNIYTKPKISDKVLIVTTLFPLYDFAKNIGGDKVEVTLLLPPGVEAHAFEPKPSDILKINDADIFIFTGKYMEPWVEDIISSISQDILVVDASEGVNLHSANINNVEEPFTKDPHIWLDFDNDKIIVQTILNSLLNKDIKNAVYYQANSTQYISDLIKLDNKYLNQLNNCPKNELVYGGHYAFGYLAKKYNLIYSSVIGLSPDAEPTAQDIIYVIDMIKSKNLKYIYYEELSDPKISQTIADETNTKLLLLNAGHNISKDSLKNNDSFISLMESNLLNLALGLECAK